MIDEPKATLAAAPWQYGMFGRLLSTGIGLTVIVAVTGEPTHVWLLVTKEGETLIKPCAGWVPVFTPAKAPIELPDPLANKPIVALELVQAYCVPVRFEVKLMATVDIPLQTVWLEIADITGVGNTTILNV